MFQHLRIVLQVLLMLFPQNGDSNNLLHDAISPLLDNLLDCTVDIVNKYFTKDLPTAVFIPTMGFMPTLSISSDYNYLDFLVQGLQQQTNQSLVTFDQIDSSVFSKKKIRIGSFILIVSGETDALFITANKILNKIFESWNPSSTLLIATTYMPKSENEEYYLARKLLRRVWRISQISDAIAVIPNPFGDRLDVYNWSPDKRHDRCLKVLDEMDHLDSWTFEWKEFLSKSNLFPKKQITDMKGCTLKGFFYSRPPLVNIRPSGFVWGTLTSELVIIADLLNFAVDPVVEGYVSNPDFIVPTSCDDDTIDLDCTFFYPYHRDIFKWYVPSGELIPRWKSLTKVFNPFMWVCTVTTFIVGSVTSWLLQKNSKSKNKPTVSFSLVLIDMFSTYLAFSVSNNHNGPVASTFFVLWLFYCLIINTAYQSALISFLADPGEYKPISTLEELHESGLNFIKLVNPWGSFEDRILGEYNFANVTCGGIDIVQCVEQVSEDRSAAVITNEFLGQMAMVETYSQTKKKVRMIPIEGNVMELYISMTLFDYGCLLFKPLEELMHRLFSSGILQWMNKEHSRYFKTQFKDFENQVLFATTLSHVQGAFYCWLAGILLACVLFVFETIFYRKKGL
ncbi:Ionotropic receptor 450 [Blattella germanica]|nr:Ionotropic receptor 450 [Blattella germanica]